MRVEVLIGRPRDGSPHPGIICPHDGKSTKGTTHFQIAVGQSNLGTHKGFEGFDFVQLGRIAEEFLNKSTPPPIMNWRVIHEESGCNCVTYCRIYIYRAALRTRVVD